MPKEEQIKLFMEKLDLTREEAIQLIADDKALNKSDCKLGLLTTEQEKVSKSMRKSSTKPKTDEVVNAYGKKQTRVKKTNQEKAELINILTEALAAKGARISVDNPERLFDFYYNDTHYRITMSVPKK